MAFLETPRTEMGNQSYVNNIENLSMEKSFLSPLKKKDDLLAQMRNNRGISLQTPRFRPPLSKHRTVPQAAVEFTPLLKSAVKGAQARRGGKPNGVPETPAVLRAALRATDSPALPTESNSMLYGGEESSIMGRDFGTPLAQIPSSSTQSTPMALPKHDGNGILPDQGNALTLREQENMLDKVEKENFGLKLKIHFLEKLLHDADPGFDAAAVKENTELKVDKVTMQRELSRVKKTLSQAERDIEDHRIHLEKAQKDAERKFADKALKKELEQLRNDVKAKSSELSRLREQLESRNDNDDSEVQKLKDAIEDLEADLRAKDRELESKDDEIEGLKEQANQDSNDIAELEEELNSAKARLGESQESSDTIKELQEEVEQARQELEEAKSDRKAALEEKQTAEDSLDGLRAEMSNKSFSTKGLSRQLEEKANKLQDDITRLSQEKSDLQDKLSDKDQEANRLRDDCDARVQEVEAKYLKLREKFEVLRKEHDKVAAKRDLLASQCEQATLDLERKSEEKDLLQSRHDALTEESRSLQRDLTKSKERLQDLEQRLQEERQHSLENDRALRDEAKSDVERLSKEADALHRELERTQGQLTSQQESWDCQRRDLESQRSRLEQRASGLERTVEKLQETKGTLSSRETQLQEAVAAEKQRHENEEAILNRHIDDLQRDIKGKQDDLENARAELVTSRDDLRVAQRAKMGLEEKVQALEDEIDVLQSNFDEESENAKQEVDAATRNAEELEEQVQSLQAQLEKLRQQKEEKEYFHVVLQQKNELVAQISFERDQLQIQLNRVEQELDGLRNEQSNHSSHSNDTSILRHELSEIRKQGSEALLREKVHKETIRELKSKITNLERDLFELQRAQIRSDSPKSVVPTSARKTEVDDLRRKLNYADQQVKEVKSKAKETERQLRRQAIDSEKSFRQHQEELENQQEALESELSNLRLQLEDCQGKNETSEQTIKRLRTRMQGLETSLQAARAMHSNDHTMAEERKDLHDMLKDAKLEAEELQVQITEREARIKVVSSREKELRSQITRIREERSKQTTKSAALSRELENLQRKYDRSVDDFATRQKQWEEERQAIVSRVRFPNMSVSSLHAGDASELKLLEAQKQEADKKHAAELRGVAKQVQWLKARCSREEGFRKGLIFEKKFLTLQVEMYNACNKVDLRLLEDMGVRPDRETNQRSPKLKTAAIMVIAAIRMRRSMQEWAGQKKIQASLLKKVEQMKQSRRSSAQLQIK
ncbi:hypothetical protein MMC25_002330 [Agyrium rufum]|nr:hypothetical protein [Agyrium rufum]